MVIKTFSKMVRPFYPIVFLGIIFIAKPAYAKDYYAMLQVTFPNIGLTQLVFQKCGSKSFCRDLNEDYWKGLRTGCPHCIKDYEGVTPSLPPSYKGIYQNKSIVFPYLSSKKDRIIFFGVPMKEAIGYCRYMVNEYKTKLNRPAIAVMPLDF